MCSYDIVVNSYKIKSESTCEECRECGKGKTMERGKQDGARRDAVMMSKPEMEETLGWIPILSSSFLHDRCELDDFSEHLCLRMAWTYSLIRTLSVV